MSMDNQSKSILENEKINKSTSLFSFKFLKNSYFRFVLKKFIFYLVILFCSLSLVWYIPRLYPTNPLSNLFSTGPSSGSWIQERQTELTKFYGLDKPLFDQFIDYWWNLLHLNLGRTYSQVGTPVIDAIAPSFYLTMTLVIPVLFIGFFLGNYIGGKMAVGKRRVNKFTYYFFVAFQSAPYYWTALIVVILFFFLQGQYSMQLLPQKYYIITDFNYDFNHPTDFLYMYSIPFFIMLLFSTGGWSTGMRAMTLYELDSPYLLYSKQLGFRQALIESYARRNAILPQITGLNLRFNELVGATLIVEYVFNYPGLGTLIVTSAQTQNYPLIVGSFVVIILSTVLGNFLLDILYGLIDPRIRTGSRN